MRILVVGSGGREHAIAWALARSGRHSLVCSPGNPGMASLGENPPVAVSDTEGMVRLASDRIVDLAVVGPEVPLVNGLGDALRSEGIPCFGPGSNGARLEGSKWFAKDVMNSAGVPTAEGRVFESAESAIGYIGKDVSRFVIKADGLAAGKGVFLPDNAVEAAGIIESLFDGGLGDSGKRLVIEERLKGREVSVLAICSGSECVLLPPSRDHKRLQEGDSGPNTGGMGAICPPPELQPDFLPTVRETIILPVLEELIRRGIDYRGILYAGLMVTDSGPRVLEFNVRFGDPETQAVLPLVTGDLAEIFMSAAKGTGLPASIPVESGCCSCVVMASGGYPGSYVKGYSISGLENIEDAVVFHAGTTVKDGRLVTGGGRVLSVASTGSTLEHSLKRCYTELGKIDFVDKYYRRDIGRTV